MSAYGLGRQYGAVAGTLGGVGTGALIGGLGSMAAGGTFASGALMAMGPYGWIAAAIAAIAGSMAKGGTPHAGGIVYSDGTDIANPNSRDEIISYYADYRQSDNMQESDWTKRYSQTISDALEPTATGIAQILNSASSVFGDNGKYTVGLAFSTDGEDKSRGRYSIVDDAGNEVFDWGRKKFDKDADDGIEEFVSATGRGIVAVLEQMDLPEWASGLLDELGDKASLEEASALVEQMKAIQTAAEKMSPALEMTADNFAEIYLLAGDAAMSAYYSLVATSSEQLADSYRVVATAFDDLGYAMPSNIAGFRALITSLDETSEEGQETIASLFQLSSAFNTVQSAIDNLKVGVADATYDLRSPQEQAAIQQQKLADAARDAGVAIPSSVDELLRLADSIDYTTQAGMQLAAAMPALASAFASAQQAAAAAAAKNPYTIDTIATDAESAVDTAFAALENAVAREKSSLASQYEAQQSAWKNAVSAAESVKSSLQSLAATLASAVESTAVESMAASMARRQSAQTDLDTALNAARSGKSLTGYSDSISSAINVFSGADASKLYGTYLDYARDQGRASATLAALSTAATDQVKVQDLQISAINSAAASAERAYNTQVAQLDKVLAGAQEQIDALNGIDNSVMTVAESIAALSSAITNMAVINNATSSDTRSTASASQAVTEIYRTQLGRIDPDAEGIEYWTNRIMAGESTSQIAAAMVAYAEYIKSTNSHATGLERVPYDGYQATLHADEAVVDAQSKAAIRRYFGVSVGTGVGSSAELAAIRALLIALRTEMVNSAAMISSNTHRSAKVLERWEGMGLPAERSTV